MLIDNAPRGLLFNPVVAGAISHAHLVVLVPASHWLKIAPVAATFECLRSLPARRGDLVVARESLVIFLLLFGGAAAAAHVQREFGELTRTHEQSLEEKSEGGRKCGIENGLRGSVAGRGSDRILQYTSSQNETHQGLYNALRKANVDG